MKVKIKDLKPNPYRDMGNYPIDQDKLKSLKDSIEQTGFWDNILARKVNGKVQIAYGHHRLEALKQIKDSSDEVDIPVKELSDAMMIKIMANENMEDWKTSPKIINETVRIVKQFLEQHPEEVKKLSVHGRLTTVGADMICSFLGWNESSVRYSLEHLRLIEEEIIDKEAIEELPTGRSARDFVDSVKKYNLPKEKQKSAVKRILETSRGKQAVSEAVVAEKFQAPPKKKSDPYQEKIKKLDDFMAEVEWKAETLLQGLIALSQLKNELKSEHYKQTFGRHILISTLSDVKDKIINLLNELEDEQTDKNSNIIVG